MAGRVARPRGRWKTIGRGLQLDREACFVVEKPTLATGPAACCRLCEGVAQLVEHVTFKMSKGKKTTDFPWFLHFPLHQWPLETPVCGCNRVENALPGKGPARSVLFSPDPPRLGQPVLPEAREPVP